MIDQVCQYVIIATQGQDWKAGEVYMMWWEPSEESWVRTPGTRDGKIEYLIARIADWPDNGWDLHLNYCELSWPHCAECDELCFNDYLCGECRG